MHASVSCMNIRTIKHSGSDDNAFVCFITPQHPGCIRPLFQWPSCSTTYLRTDSTVEICTKGIRHWNCAFYGFQRIISGSRSSSVSTVTRQRAGRPGFNFRQGQWREFSLCHRVRIGSGAHPASYPMSTGWGGFPGGKEAGTWSWSLTSIYRRGYECVELYICTT